MHSLCLSIWNCLVIFNVIVPIAFKNTDYIYNNVGALLLTISEKDTPNSITKKLAEKSYHILATNHLMQLVNKGKDTRNTMDAVFTIGFIKNPNIVIPSKLEKMEVSYRDISFYGLYFASFTYGDVAHLSLTIMTNMFDTDNFLKEEKGSYLIF